MSKNIVLCGFMGSGKTTVGRLLAKRLLAGFIDLDEAIEQQEERSIPTIFAEEGEDYFRSLEHAVLGKALRGELPAGLLTPRAFTVLAAGGGTFMREDNVALLREDGAIVIYLSTDFDVCYERIRESNRPIVMRSTREELHALYEKRHKIYADICTTQMYNHASPNAVVENIISVISPFSIQKL